MIATTTKREQPDSLRALPGDADAEISTDGSVLLNPEVLDDVLAICGPSDFLDPRLGLILQACIELRDKGIAIDVVTVANHLGPKLDDGLALIVRACDSVPHSHHAAYYAGIVKANADRRRIIEASRATIVAAHDTGLDVSEQIASARDRLDRIEDGRGSADDPIQAGKLALDVLLRFEEGQAETVIPTGFEDIDKLFCGGLRGSQSVALGARPGQGKTALAGRLATNIAKAGHPVLFISLEMPGSELLERLMAAEAGVSHENIRRRRADEMEQFALTEAGNALAAIPLQIVDKPRQTVASIASMARRMKRRSGLAVLILDYLQLLVPTDGRQTREVQVAQQSRELKLLAKELGIAVVALCQLNRALEAREVKSPRLSDLRESGAIEQDADIVMLLHRDDDDTGATDLIVAKNRSGRTGRVSLLWRPSQLLFVPGWKGNQ